MAHEALVYVPKRDRRTIARVKKMVTKIVEPYDSFLLVQATDETIRLLRELGTDARSCPIHAGYAS